MKVGSPFTALTPGTRQVTIQLICLTDRDREFLPGCEAGGKTVGEIVATMELGLDGVRSLQERQLILLSC